MIVADASVLVAILKGEPDAEALAARLDSEAGQVWISPVVRYEAVTSVAVARAGSQAAASPSDFEEAGRRLDELIKRFGAREMPITAEVGRLALDAQARFGKLAGHPARLNMGDCFAHACAASLGAALLYKGGDFARTDLA